LARRVKSFQVVDQFINVTHCIATLCSNNYVKALILFLFRHLLKRFHAMFGLRQTKQHLEMILLIWCLIPWS